MYFFESTILFCKHLLKLDLLAHRLVSTEEITCNVMLLTTGNYNSMNPGCVTNMVTQLGWDLLEHRRAKHRTAMLYKIITNLANILILTSDYRFSGIPCRMKFVNYRHWNSFSMHFPKSLYHHFCIDDLGFSFVLYYAYIEIFYVYLFRIVLCSIVCAGVSALKLSILHTEKMKMNKCVIFKCYSSEELITLNTLHEVVPTWYSFHS